RPSGYEPDELPDCSTPRLSQCFASIEKRNYSKAHSPASTITRPGLSICRQAGNIPHVFNALKAISI
ncbi:hypothetical protein, partial [Thiobacillus sp.]|uniref:hypothetical protein n=1 Tax=Thiobacillus sp. TaxID=924 RepID=UPI00286DA08D